jgi:nucleoside-diphosphate-sugar epimerase
MNHILISGGAGFIGINLTTYLLENTEHCVIVFDNHICSNVFYQSIMTTFENKYANRFFFFERDICDKEIVESIISAFPKIDEIYHFASIASPIFYKKYPLETLEVGYTGSKHMFELAKHYQAKILIASTSEIYGDPSISPQNESYFGNVNCFGPRSCYDESKRIMETLAYVYLHEHKVDVKIARIFNTYGPYMNIEDGRIIPSLIDSFLHHKPIQIFNGGKQTRSFNYIDDTLHGLISLMSSSLNIPVNIGNDEEISIWDTYLEMKDIFERRYLEYRTDNAIEYGWSDENDPKVRKPDLTVAKRELDYQIRTEREEGFCKTIDYFIEYFTYSKKMIAKNV